MQRNVSSQKLTLFVFDYSTGAPKTGDAANLTFYVSKDDGSVTALADTSAAELDSTNAKGLYTCDLAQGETDAVKLVFSGKSSTANATVVPETIYTTPANSSLQSIDSNGRLDVIKVAGTTQTAGDLAAMLTIIDDFIDLEVAAIKAKTDNLPASFPSNFASMTITAAGGVTLANGVTHGGTTAVLSLGSMTILGAMTVSNGVIITCSTTDRSAISATGNGAGSGIDAFGGANGSAGIWARGRGAFGTGMFYEGDIYGVYIQALNEGGQAIYGANAGGGADACVQFDGNNAAPTLLLRNTGGDYGLDTTLSPATLALFADKFLGRTIAGGGDGGRTVTQALAASRNKVAFNVPGAGQFTVFADDDTTPLWTGTFSTTSGAAPIRGVDPA